MKKDSALLRGPGIPIQLNELQSNVDVVPQRVQVFRTTTLYHPVYGKVEITKEVLASMAKNFAENVRRLDLAIDYKHDSDNIAAGWIRSLTLMEDGTQLWATVEWTTNGRRVLAEKEFRYLSPDFNLNYQDNETLQKFGPVLLGAGLTNRPVIKDMTPAIELSEYALAAEPSPVAAQPVPPIPAATIPKGPKMPEMTIEQAMAKIKELEAQISALQNEKEGALAEKKMAEKTTSFNKLMTDGKACEAQRVPFMEGDSLKFAELAQPLKLKPEGTSAGGAGEPGAVTEDAADKVLKLAEAKISGKHAKTQGEAISMVLHENPELAKKYNEENSVR